jgi:phosphatidylglycerol:prolipoprotein diacylglycerol transferase
VTPGASYTVPFLHTEWLLVAAVVAVIAGSALPARRWRGLAAMAIGAVVAAIAAVVGWIPWKGELHLAVYGLLMLVGFAAAYAMMLPRARLVGIEERRVIDIFLIAIVAGLAGARARYVWEAVTAGSPLRPDEFLYDPATHQRRPLGEAIARMVDFDRGGMVWYGGMVLAALLIVLYAWRTRLRVLALGDVVAPALLLGLGIGRIGCFFNGCCYGHPTGVPWACLHDGVRVHPTQLYETIACSIMAALLWWFWRRRRADGQVLFLGTVGYGAWRFTNEILRGDDKIPSNLLALPSPGSPIDTSQVTSLHLVIVAIVVALAVRWYRRGHPQAAAVARAVPGSRYAPVSAAPAPPAVALPPTPEGPRDASAAR